MTDNEIIKALECCMFITPNKKCNECPKFNEDVECSVKLHRHALDLINRQRREIETMQNAASAYETAYHRIKSEAIKEFADRLRNCFCVSKEYLDIVNIIDNLVKEMTEVNENE